MSGLLDKLKALKTSEQWDETIPDLEDAVEAAKKQIAILRDKKEEAIFEGSEKDRQKLREEIREAEADLEEKQIALAGAQKRRDEAAKQELEESVLARHKEAGRLKEDLHKKYVRFHELASELAPLAKEIQDTCRLIQDAHRYAIANGRRDLKGRPPLGDLAERLDRQILDPTLSLKITGYTHGSNPVESPLAKL